jgi:hypothetical protein
MFGKHRFDFLIRCKSPFAGRLEAAIDASQFVRRSTICAAPKAGVDLQRDLGEFFLGLFGPLFRSPDRFFKRFRSHKRKISHSAEHATFISLVRLRARQRAWSGFQRDGSASPAVMAALVAGIHVFLGDLQRRHRSECEHPRFRRHFVCLRHDCALAVNRAMRPCREAETNREDEKILSEKIFSDRIL